MREAHRPVGEEAVQAFLADDGAAWSLVDGRLHRDLRFPGFADALRFMAEVAPAAERLDHHPDWSNSGSRVSIDLITHASGAISALDIELARAIDRVARGRTD